MQKGINNQGDWTFESLDEAINWCKEHHAIGVTVRVEIMQDALDAVAQARIDERMRIAKDIYGYAASNWFLADYYSTHDQARSSQFAEKAWWKQEYALSLCLLANPWLSGVQKWFDQGLIHGE